jgi:hypothetical protein
MLSKCANPACGAKFQYLHIGRLFAIEYRRTTQGCLFGNSELVQIHDRYRYFWLCPACCQSMTIQRSGAGGVRIAHTAKACKIDLSHVRDNIRVPEDLRSDRQGRGCSMFTTNEKRNALVKELEFVERGGYRQTLGWRPALIFEDSPICPKPPFAACPYAECVLLEFVPEGRRTESLPCQHIPLNQTGETLSTMYNTAAIDEIENALREWLRKRIAEMEQQTVRPVPILTDDAA